MCSSCALSSYLGIWSVVSILIVLFESVGTEAYKFLALNAEMSNKLSSAPHAPTCMRRLRIGRLELGFHPAPLDAAITRPTCTCAGFGCAGKEYFVKYSADGVIFYMVSGNISRRMRMKYVKEYFVWICLHRPKIFPRRFG